MDKAAISEGQCICKVKDCDSRERYAQMHAYGNIFQLFLTMLFSICKKFPGNLNASSTLDNIPFAIIGF